MKRASITEAKNGLSALIDGLRRGTGVLIVDRGRPVARLEPVSQAPAVLEDSRLMRLVRDGIVRPAKVPLSKALLSGPLPVPKDGASAVSALLDERRHGR
ncbi:MAG TPA: type II toxin-antitoxin system prevent-host-death family antitoxin [Reyranella sp.]|jgi:prevent-host-death family protein|nr:type II toxin-antitoxin system prevent-host-death family antitoxin [Reyranella sp.]